MAQLTSSAFQAYDPNDASSIVAGPFALYTVAVDDLAATQLNVGFAEVDSKSDGFDEITSTSALSADLLGDIEPVVIGPGGVLYQTDGHHTFLALIDSSWGASDPMVDVNIIANYSSDTEAQFIAQMEQNNLLYPVNDGVLETVNTTTGAPLPTSLTGLSSDVYRGLEYSILKNKNSKLFAGGASTPGLDKTAAFYSDFIWADAYRGANNGLGLPYLSPYDIDLSTNWNLTPTSATTLPNVGAVTVAQLPGFILPTGDSIVITGTISNSTLANGTLDGSQTGTFNETTTFASFNGLRALDLGPVTIGAAATGFVMQLGNDDGGTVTLSGQNTYTGGTTFLAGTLIITSDASLGAAAGTAAINLSRIDASIEADNGIIFNSLTEGNGTLQFGATATPGVNSFTENRPIGIDGEVANFNLNGNTITLTGEIYSMGAISEGLSNADGEAGITVEDTSSSANGVLILAGSDSNPYFYGNWIISSGTLQVSSDASLGNTTGSIYSLGEIELNGGTLQAGASFTSVRSLFLGGGSTYDVNGYNTVWEGNLDDVQRTLEVINSSTTTAGSVAFGTFEVNSTATLYISGSAAAPTTVTFTNGLIRDPGATLILNPASGTLGTTTKVFDTSTGAGATNTVTAGIVSPWLVIDSGTSSSTANPYSFATYGANGFVAATTSTPGVTNNITTSTVSNTVIQSSNVTAAGNLAAYSLSIQSGDAVTLGSHTLTLGDGADPAGLILNGTAGVLGGTLATGGSELIVWLGGGSSGANTLSAVLTGSGGLTIAGGLASTAVSKSKAAGSGALTISTATQETGAVTIDTGLVTLSAVNAFFSATPGVMLDDTKTAPSPADLTITANNQFTALQSDGNNSTVTISSGAILTIGDTTNNLSSVLDSQITETGAGVAGAITKDGSGLLDLSGANGVTLTSGGTVQVNGGALRIANSIFSTSATNAINLAAGTELQYAGNGGSKFNDPITGAGAFHLLGGTVELTSTGNTYTGGTYIENGATLDVTTANLPVGGKIVNVGGILDFDQSTSGTFTGVMSDGLEAGGPNDPDDLAYTADGPNLSGTLIKDDSSGNNSGNVTLGAVQTYTGATYVEAGTLTLGVANAIADSSGVTLGRVGFASTAVLALSANNTITTLSSDAGSTTSVTLNGKILTVDPLAGESATFGGTISDGSSSGGSLVIDGPGTEILTGNDTFAGGVALENGTLDIGAHDAAGTGTITFESATDPTLLISAADTPANGGAFENTLVNFGNNDELDIAGLSYSSGATATYSAATGQLAVTSNGETIYFDLSGTVAPAYYVHEDSNGDALVNDTSAPCYLRGTLIRTDRGEIAVEDLGIGDRLVTLSGAAMPLKWIGRRCYSGWRAEGNGNVQPIRFKAGALADRIPSRDLLVSPEHAMFLDGALIPAKLLVNGLSIVAEEAMAEIEYFHLELAEHSVIVAEGAWSESFVDDHSRGMFHNAHEFHMRYPNAPRGGQAEYCAPRVEDGAALETARRTLMARAGRLLPGGVAAPAPRLRGALDTVNRASVQGWAFDPAAPDVPLEIAILDNGVVIGQATANLYRADLEAAGVGDGRHSFRFILPCGFASGVSHAIQIRCMTSWLLIGQEAMSPKVGESDCELMQRAA